MENPTYRLEGIVKDKNGESDFEGPLSLILMLLSKNKIEIRDINISDILEQYTAYLEQMENMDLEVASEFIQMASHLLYIKTKMLLNLHDEEVNELEQLIASLEQLVAAKSDLSAGDTVKLTLTLQNSGNLDFTNVTVTPGASGPKKDVVLNQSHEKSTEVAIDTEIEVVVCVGPVTKADVSFELPGGGGEDPGKVTVVITNVTTGEEVFNGQFSAADTEVKVDLTGYGKMTYEVTVDGMVYSTGLDIVVDFDAE